MGQAELSPNLCHHRDVKHPEKSWLLHPLCLSPQDPFQLPHISWSHYDFPSEKQKFFIFVGDFVFCSRQLFLLLGSRVDTTTLSISCPRFLGLLTGFSQAYRLLQTEPKCFNFVIVFLQGQVPAPTLIIVARSFQFPPCSKFLHSCKENADIKLISLKKP